MCVRYIFVIFFCFFLLNKVGRCAAQISVSSQDEQHRAPARHGLGPPGHLQPAGLHRFRGGGSLCPAQVCSTSENVPLVCPGS